MESTWGLLGPGYLPSVRRSRTLGLGASVRTFNDLAVPGLGGVWYGKQLLLATLGVVVAQAARSQGAKVQNVEVANAIEALGCRLAFDSNGWSSDARLRGSTKLYGTGSDLGFARVRQRNYYVTQPMRMATVQALPALGLVASDSARFNAFCGSDRGRDFVDLACKDFRPYQRSVVQHLTLWVCGRDDRVGSDALRNALSPLVPLDTGAVPLLREALLQGGDESQEDKRRRSNALAWVDAVQRGAHVPMEWDVPPREISTEHWHDLAAGARLFSMREAAIAVLDALESHIGNQSLGLSYALWTALPEELLPGLTALRTAAHAFLATQHRDKAAHAFACACVLDDGAQILRFLTGRDGQVLRLVGETVKPGPAFRGAQRNEGATDPDVLDAPETGDIPLPDGISYRVRNLFLLSADMQGGLSQWLEPTANGVSA